MLFRDSNSRKNKKFPLPLQGPTHSFNILKYMKQNSHIEILFCEFSMASRNCEFYEFLQQDAGNNKGGRHLEDRKSNQEVERRKGWTGKANFASPGFRQRGRLAVWTLSRELVPAEFGRRGSGTGENWRVR
jgi:hypothetical protein